MKRYENQYTVLPIGKRLKAYSHVDPATGCWLWLRSKNSQGYGSIRFQGRTWVAHRCSFSTFRGPIPSELCVLHRCDVPACINPDHLFLGTLGDNNRDRSAKGRDAKGDRNGSRLHPESRPRGDRHYFKLFPEKVLRGEAHGSARLTEADVLEIRRRRSTRETLSSIAADYSITPQLVYRIAKRLCWKHLE